MSFIFFDGNTYTFGATVSANLGTGTTSYVFGGLSSGATFGFILRAFNGFGFSNFVGPVLSKTLQQILEVRDEIPALAWNYPYMEQGALVIIESGSTVNQIVSSEDLGNTYVWTNVSSMGLIRGITAPDGSTTAFGLSGNNYFTNEHQGRLYPETDNQNLISMESGNTYIYSIWHNLSGTKLDAFRIFDLATPSPFATIKQILPIEGPEQTTNRYLWTHPSGPTAPTGWVRYAATIKPNHGPTGTVLLYAFYFAEINLSPTLPTYVWGPQFERV
jgi:hypothetical protein